MAHLARRTRDAWIGCGLTAAAILAVVLVLSSPDRACAQVEGHWQQLNGWASQALLRPFALLLQAC